MNPDRQAADALAERSGPIAEAAVALHFADCPDLDDRYGRKGRTKCHADALFTLRHLAAAVSTARPSLFVDYILWLRILLAGYRIPAEDIVRTLIWLDRAIRSHLDSKAGDVVAACLSAGIESLQRPVGEPPSFVDDFALARQYLTIILSGRRSEAFALVEGAVEAGMPIRDVYLKIFQPSQYEIGRLWQINRISVAQEHFCSAATQLLMARLYPHMFRQAKKAASGRRLVAACVGGDLHELGLRMVADFFEMDGWDTHYLGANLPLDGLAATLLDHPPNVVALSATMPYHLGQLQEMISAIRAKAEIRNIPILAGGAPFMRDPGLAGAIGADATAVDASRAVDAGNRLAEGQRP